MRFSTVITPLALASSALAVSNDTIVTVTTDIVVTDYTTWCPFPTQFVINNSTVTVATAGNYTYSGVTIEVTTTTNGSISIETEGLSPEALSALSSLTGNTSLVSSFLASLTGAASSTTGSAGSSNSTSSSHAGGATMYGVSGFVGIIALGAALL